MSRGRRESSSAHQLIDAVLGGGIEEVRSLLAAGHDANGRDRDRRTPLHHASTDGRADIVKLLIESGADVNAADANQWTPLHFAAQDYHAAVARILVESGARVDAADAFGNTALGTAVFNSGGRGELIEILLAAGADRTKRNISGVSPRELAKNIANYKVPLD